MNNGTHQPGPAGASKKRCRDGAIMQLASPELVAMAGRNGCDFVIIDCEHGSRVLKTTLPRIMREPEVIARIHARHGRRHHQTIRPPRVAGAGEAFAGTSSDASIA